jgi:hypothetical protein
MASRRLQDRDHHPLDAHAEPPMTPIEPSPTGRANSMQSTLHRRGVAIMSDDWIPISAPHEIHAPANGTDQSGQSALGRAQRRLEALIPSWAMPTKSSYQMVREQEPHEPSSPSSDKPIR